MRAYWDVQGELTVGNGLLLRGHSIVVPKALQKETLEKLHDGHQGMVRCRLRAKSSIWWPGLSKQLTAYIHACPVCARTARPRKEPLIPTTLPEYPWQQVATDLFTLNGSDYLVIVDYFSRYPEVIQLDHQCPQVSLRQTWDTGESQWSTIHFKRICGVCRDVQFRTHHEQPPLPSQQWTGRESSADRQTALVDPSIALLSYRSTPLPWYGRSPAELLMGRNLRSTVPQTTESQWPYLPEFQKINETFRRKQKQDHDHRHRARDLPDIPDNTNVWVTHQTTGRTVTQDNTPRSYIVETPKWRNTEKQDTVEYQPLRHSQLPHTN